MLPTTQIAPKRMSPIPRNRNQPQELRISLTPAKNGFFANRSVDIFKPPLPNLQEPLLGVEMACGALPWIWRTVQRTATDEPLIRIGPPPRCNPGHIPSQISAAF